MHNVLLTINAIKKRYDAHEVLKNINLTIYRGEIVSLLGVNGAGKTTLSSIIATLHPASSGDIKHEGASISDNIPEFRKKLGYCPQYANLNGMLTLEENLLFAGRFYGLSDVETEQRIESLAIQLDLKKYLSQKPEVLSGGYKQRFMIARSLLHHPEFLILDEPTVGLDPHVRRNLWEIIKNLKGQGITILLTTHYLDEAEKLSDRVCILDKGEIKLIDTPQNLMNQFKHTNLEDVFIELLKNAEQ